MPHALIAIYAPELNLIYTSRIVAEPLENIINQSGVYQSFLMSNLGKFHFSNQSEISDEILKTALSKYVLADQMQQGVKDIPIEDKDFLISFQKMPNLNLTIVSQIAKEKAYSMAQFLIQKSFAFALMVISLAVIVGSFVSTSLTRPIETLMSATKHIANGNFKNKVDITSKDELSVLGNAFNHMSDEIIHYMEEVKEKVRMEDELAVAQLVQSSFFPADDSQYGNLAVAGHYKSASECGGDWWGSLKIGDKVFLFVGDATGHGVPAALVTATANCCANMIIELSKTNPAYLNSPAAVLEMMSNSVYKLGGKILMTFFVGIYDDKTGKLVYSNASHNSPIIYRHSPDEPNKKDIIVLMDAIGPRLGHKENPEYSDAETYLNEEDVLLLFSDGMIEAQNPKNQQWGDRRFIKSFLQYAKQSPREMINGLIKDAYSFYEEVPPDDDITLVIAKKGKNV
jgi:sigma-B regulation protein RsbU (phosphoserine phosphatase)